MATKRDKRRRRRKQEGRDPRAEKHARWAAERALAHAIDMALAPLIRAGILPRPLDYSERMANHFRREQMKREAIELASRLPPPDPRTAS